MAIRSPIQFGFNLLTGKSNAELSNLCRKITSYLYDIALFLIFEEMTALRFLFAVTVTLLVSTEASTHLVSSVSVPVRNAPPRTRVIR